MTSHSFQRVWEPLCTFLKDGGLYCNFRKIWGQNIILEISKSKCNFEENWGQNMNIGKFWVKYNFGKFYGLKCKYGKICIKI